MKTEPSTNKEDNETIEYEGLLYRELLQLIILAKKSKEYELAIKLNELVKTHF
jgi:hypothetical protein